MSLQHFEHQPGIADYQALQAVQAPDNSRVADALYEHNQPGEPDDGSYRLAFGYVHNGEVTFYQQRVVDTEPTGSTVDAKDASHEIEEAEIAETSFSVRAAANYLNPVRAGRAYGRFLKRCFKEFGIPEVVGTATTMAAGYAAHKIGGDVMNGWPTALAGSAGETVGFYGASFLQRYRELRRDDEAHYTRRQASVEARRYLVSTYIVAEVVDQATRPTAMWAVPAAFEGLNTTLSLGINATTSAMSGLLGGKILADHIHYGIAIPFSNAYRKRAAVRRDAKVAQIATSLDSGTT